MSGHAPRVLVSGVVLGQHRSGVRRWAEQVLPRMAQTFTEDGGRLVLLEPRGGTQLATGTAIETRASELSPGPAWRRVRAEGRALASCAREARAQGQPFDAILSGHLPLPRVAGEAQVHLLHDLRTLHGFGPWWKRLAAGRLVESAVRRAQLVVCVGESVRADLATRHRGTRTRVLGHGGDHLPLVPRAPEGFLLTVGHLEERKNLALVLDALASDTSLPRLVVVGVGPDEAATRDAVHGRGLDGRVELRGSVDDAELAALFARAGCAVFPSRFEGFGLGLLEARRAGVPLAASTIPAHVERLEPGDARFAPNDPAACARALHAALATEPGTREVPTWQSAADGWSALFRELANAPLSSSAG